jgi:thiazolinyl imide reductase
MKVLICGSLYGASYLRALTLQAPDTSQPILPAGIFSTGSERSQAYAKAANVPNYSHISELPSQTIDIACIAISGQAGQQLALGLLQRGIDVIYEHPVDPKFVATALDIAQQNQRHFFVNAHFGDLPAPQAFINSHRVAEQQGLCLHYDLAVNPRSLYSGLDILGRTLGSLSGLKVSLLGPNENLHFANLLIQGPSINVLVICQNFTSAQDDGSAAFVNHRLNSIYTHGSLSMNETCGPVSWQPNMASQQWQSVMPVKIDTINHHQLQQQRDQANLTVIQNLVAHSQGQPCPPEQQPEYLLALSSLWRSCCSLLQPSRSH